MMTALQSPFFCKLVASIAAMGAIIALTVAAGAGDTTATGPQDYVFGAPAEPTDLWTLSAGGRIYDRWWNALDRDEPTETHPSYPASGKKSGSTTWRCKECHGWDYRGRDGRYGKGSRATGIKGIDGAKGRDPAEIAALLRAALHGYTQDKIRDDELARVAQFVSRGQDDIARYVESKTGAVNGDAMRGKSIFQTTCAACHGFDGRLLNWGTADEPAVVGTDANAAPDEVFHKIRNGHPGAAMINLRAFPLDDAAAVLAYAKTLPKK